MSQITMIEAQKHQGRYNIYVDGAYAFPVSEAVLIEFRVFKGMDVTPKLKKQLIHADDVSRAFNRALDYLANQLRTEKEVIDKLVALDIPEDVREQTLRKLRDLNLIDDAKYAGSYVRTMKLTSDKGPRVIRQNLRHKGVGENLIDDALEEFSVTEQIENALATAKKLTKRYQNKPFSMQKPKITQALMSRGFGHDEIEAVFTELELVPDEEKQAQLLDHDAERLWHRFRGRKPSERKQKTRQALYRKGYAIDAINYWFEDHEETLQADD
ncbi:recombination regulator RecX [Levilactobacillus bambusae]|uniref:Regulatory protein RecX n=1 Tax=Levilactobacillus bambusae TaxID=2024736 RepID=A0A2V1MY46_9LACO|nr:recombination regulator RecX [Levilactobacillus bambusae]PWF99906.1 recombination regulator RecX [Levilactobacillus bambusae]